MKHILYSILIASTPLISRAQSGLDSLVLETYYITDDQDSGTPSYPVPDDAVTYRIYVDMAPMWELQAIFSSTNASTGEVDTIVIRSTQPFFNNEDRGRAFGYQVPTANLDENTVALDSWFSTGRSSNTTEGTLKPEDTNAGAPAFPNLDDLLQHNDPSAGIPITLADGNIPGTITTTWTLIGITPMDLLLFDNQDLFGNEFVETDGAFTSFSTPLHGPTANNRVLIGQFTTAGNFSGQLNVQLRHSITGEIQQWVAESPAPGQFTSPSLKWISNTPPQISITSPLDGSNFLSGDTIHTNLLVFDIDGSIIQVQFLYNDIPLGIDNMAPFQFSFAPNADGIMTVIATDNMGAQTTSAPVSIKINPYTLQSVHQLCNPEKVRVPLHTVGYGIMDAVSIEAEIRFDVDQIVPTGMLFKSHDLIDADLYAVHSVPDILNGKILVTARVNTTAPPGTVFNGIGNIFFVEFEKRPAFEAEDSSWIYVAFVQDTLLDGSTHHRDTVPASKFSTTKNQAYIASLAFWADQSPIQYDPANPADYLVTEMRGTDEICTISSSPAQHPDLNGSFTHSLHEGFYLAIDRDIQHTTDVQPVINSFDAFLVRKFLLNDPAYTPSIFEVISMDVNQDGFVSAGDLSQINQRAVLATGEFIQVWNYDNQGHPLPGYQPSKDWVFVNRNTIEFDPAFAPSGTLPQDDGIGYSKFRVPVIPHCLWTEVEDLPFHCPEIKIDLIYGMLPGDVNGNYRFIKNDGLLK